MKSIQIDSEGYFKFGDTRVVDNVIANEVFQTLQQGDKGEYKAKIQGEEYLVEAFDEPLVAKQVFKGGSQWEIQAPYDFRQKFSPEKLTVDDWDRFHGVTDNGIPFVFSRDAQAEFFRLVDELHDESVTIDGKEIPVPYWFKVAPDVNRSDFWTNIYNTEEPGWDMKGPTPVLVNVLPKIKLTKQRIIVLGCGEGHDAAYLAERGHIVTAVDFSEEAIARAKSKYGHISTLKFFCGDIFRLPDNWRGEFDIVFEHTCYCAVNPERRPELIKVWRSLLAPGGKLLGIFFAINKFQGPPFGGSEFEIYQRLKKGFRFLIWERAKDSHPRRLGRELLVYAEKLDLSDRIG